ncbi:alpha/beta fold hydrolase [Tenacibaculum aiptasiae]|uniref:alpha/beta fold hydrolase n=1 Tax=Tenacibaculum aiptasiae TaxID=426481 RepID=UPI003B5A24FF
MKQLGILILVLLIQNITFSQTKKNEYPFKVETKGKGKPIILIPGMASSGDVWNQTVDSLKTKYQCHILTLAGFEKQKPINLEKGFLPRIKEEIVKYIKTELNEKPILIGHSLGGFLILSISSTYPKLLSKIIIIDSYPFGPLVYNPNATKQNIKPQAKQMKEMLLVASNSQFAAQQETALKMMITDSNNIKLATKWSLESDRATIAQSTFELMITDLRPEIKKVTIPILVLGSWYGLKNYGFTEEIVKANYKNQFITAKNCKIKIAKKAKHFIMLDDPNWTLQEIKSFMLAYE